MVSVIRLDWWTIVNFAADMLMSLDEELAESAHSWLNYGCCGFIEPKDYCQCAS